jgi:hypothetical protein
VAPPASDWRGGFQGTSAALPAEGAWTLTISQGPWTALISIFSSQPVALAENFPSRPSSDMIVFVSVLRRISGRSLLINPPGLLVRNYFAEPNLTFGQRGPSFRGCLGVDGGGFCQ